jgi:hypothetical protein
MRGVRPCEIFQRESRGLSEDETQPVSTRGLFLTSPLADVITQVRRMRTQIDDNLSMTILKYR